MADLKPLGSEKLNGDDKLKRILELTYYKNDNNKGTTKAEIVKESKSGGVYGIVKERDGYYVKRGLNESSLDYIGGMFMKNKNKFSSYAEALKRLELIKGQDELLNEATKYVLKQNKPQEETPAPVPAMPEEPAAPVDDMPPMDAGGAPAPSSEEPAAEEPAADDMGDMGDIGDEEEVPSENKRSDYMADAQKYAGKLGQELRDLHDKMESDDIKYILNMIISAVDLDKLDDEDIEEIAKKFEREEDELGGEELPAEEPSSEPSPEEDMNEYDGIDALEEFVGTPMDTGEINLSKYAIKETNEVEEQQDDVQELDLDEIKNEINKMTNEILSKHFK